MDLNEKETADLTTQKDFIAVQLAVRSIG